MKCEGNVFEGKKIGECEDRRAKGFSKTAFTLAEGTPCTENLKWVRRHAFTLAEVLIVIAVVGVIAALTMPTLINTISEKVKKQKIEVFEKKLNEGTDLLAVDNGIGPYYESTEQFLKALSKHMKIIQICNKNNMRNCIPYGSLTKSSGEAKTIEQYSTDDSTGLGFNDSDYGEVSGVSFINGTHMMLSWNKKCPALDPDTPYQNTSSCISGWYDINGSSGPNRWGKDIIGFHSMYRHVHPSPLSKAECEKIKNSMGIKKCPIDNDYWAAIVKECGGVWNMAGKDDYVFIMTKLFKNADGSSLLASQMSANWFDLENKVAVDKSMYGKSVNGFKITDYNQYLYLGESADGNGAYSGLFSMRSGNRITYGYGAKGYSYIAGLCIGE